MHIIKHPSATEAIIEKTYSKEELQKLEKRILEAKCSEYNIPGFRPGNAPLEKVREILQSNNEWEELMGIKLQESLISEWSKNKGRELGEIVKMVNVKKTKEEPLTLECHFEYFPRLKEEDIANKYFDLKINKKTKPTEIEVSDKEVEEGIAELQKRRTMLKPVNEALGEDKLAFIKIIHSENNSTEGKEDKELFQWGKGQLGKEFDEKTKGLKEGEEKEIDEKKKVRIEKVFVSEAPEINDDFAKSLGHFHDLTDLKVSIKKGIRMEKLYQELEARRESLIQALLEAIKVEVPESIVERSARNYQQEFEKRVGKSIDKSKEADPEQAKIKNVFNEKARRELKLQRVLEAIALEEKIIPKEEEVDKEVEKILQSFSKPKEANDAFGTPEELKSRVTLSLCFEKTLQFLEKKNETTKDVQDEIDKLEKEMAHKHKHD